MSKEIPQGFLFHHREYNNGMPRTHFDIIVQEPYRDSIMREIARVLEAPERGGTPKTPHANSEPVKYCRGAESHAKVLGRRFGETFVAATPEEVKYDLTSDEARQILDKVCWGKNQKYLDVY